MGAGLGASVMSRKRILFIDNRPEHLQQPVLRLQFAGYDVETAGGGAEGLRRLAGGGFDVLILDADLPNEDGWSVLRMLCSSRPMASAV